MTLQEFQSQALQLSIGDRWRLVQSLLDSIQQETLPVSSSKLGGTSVADLDLWTQSLMGVAQLGEEQPIESYIDYLVEKYN
jgi:hypothetical protein